MLWKTETDDENERQKKIENRMWETAKNAYVDIWINFVPIVVVAVAAAAAAAVVVAEQYCWEVCFVLCFAYTE